MGGTCVDMVQAANHCLRRQEVFEAHLGLKETQELVIGRAGA